MQVKEGKVEEKKVEKLESKKKLNCIALSQTLYRTIQQDTHKPAQPCLLCNASIKLSISFYHQLWDTWKTSSALYNCTPLPWKWTDLIDYSRDTSTSQLEKSKLQKESAVTCIIFYVTLMAPEVGEDKLAPWEGWGCPILSSRASFSAGELIPIRPAIDGLLGRDLGDGIPEGWEITGAQVAKLPCVLII